MAKTILVLAANPTNTDRLRLAKEVREITSGLERAKNRDEFILKQTWAARPVEARRAMLDYKPNIVHFCGHGAGEEGIVFEDDNGMIKLVSSDTIADFFELFADKVECVVLNACYSESQADAIAKHIHYVIGMKSAIGDEDAIEFAVAFYDAIGAGKSIEFSHKLACNAIQWGGKEHLTPALKMKPGVTDPDGGIVRKIKGLPGIIGALALLIIAIGIIHLLRGFDAIYPGTKSKNIEYKPIAVKYPKTIPSYLVNTIGEEERAFRYWFQFDVKSDKNKAVRGTITLTLDNLLPDRLRINEAGIASKQNEKSFEIKNPPGEKSIRFFDAWFVNPDKEIQLDVRWTYRDEKGNYMQETDPAHIKLLPKNIFYWDLTDGDGKPVPQDFLVASLSSWILRADIGMEEARDKIKEDAYNEMDYDHVIRRWFEKWYAELFQGRERITVGPHPFHMEGTLEIKTPSQVLKGKTKTATPLEAALLIAAIAKADLLKSESDARLILFAIPEGTSREKALFLAWLTSPDKRWHALRMCCASEGMNFEENERHASGIIERLQNEAPYIFKELDDKGVYLDKKSQILALDFEKAKMKYQIAALQ
jgi:hypothetical protein